MGLVKALSTDHNTGNQKERERIYATGGTIKDNRLVLETNVIIIFAKVHQF